MGFVLGPLIFGNSQLLPLKIQVTDGGQQTLQQTRSSAPSVMALRTMKPPTVMSNAGCAWQHKKCHRSIRKSQADATSRKLKRALRTKILRVFQRSPLPCQERRCRHACAQCAARLTAQPRFLDSRLHHPSPPRLAHAADVASQHSLASVDHHLAPGSCPA